MMKTITTNRFRLLRKMAAILFALLLIIPLFLSKAEAGTVSDQDNRTENIERQESRLPPEDVALGYRAFSRKELALSFVLLYIIIQIVCHEKPKLKKGEDENDTSDATAKKSYFRTLYLPIILCVVYFIVMAILAPLRG